jgi:hypothetical protein
LTERKLFKKRVEHKEFWLFATVWYKLTDRHRFLREGLNTRQLDVFCCHGLTERKRLQDCVSTNCIISATGLFFHA